jgi:hypothetical protein
MAKHRFVTGVTVGSEVMLYRCPSDGTVAAVPDVSHTELVRLPVRFDGSGAFVEPVVTDAQLTAMSTIFAD